MQTGDLVKVEDISTRLINTKGSPYQFCTVKASKKKELEQEGWELIPSKLRKSIRMRKPKLHFNAFEDRVWALFAKMRFESLNKDNQFELEYKPGLTKRVDVFAADKEAILVIECKSSAIRNKVRYQKDINELIGMKDGLRRASRELFQGKPKVAFIFATNNSILSENDKKRLTESAIFHFNEADIEYWERLVDHLGPAAKYQLFGKLFEGQYIPNLPNRVPAIKGKIAPDLTCYSFSIDPESLLRMGFVLHRTETNVETSKAYQRLVNKTRLQHIGKFIDNGGYFPNSIIVNIETKKNKDLKFEHAKAIDHDSDTSLGILHLPRAYRSVFIIDGQHRLYGYSKAKSKSPHTIPVVAFLNLPEKEQSKIFVDINHLQKPVPTNLLHSIMAVSNWESDDASQAISALKTRLISHMNFDDSSPFYKRIVITEEKHTDTRCLTLQTIRKWGLSSKTGFFGKVRGKQPIKTGYLTDISYEATLNKSVVFFNYCFGYIKDKLQDQWNIGNGGGGFISMNIGVTASMKTIDCVLDHLVRLENLHPEDLSGKELANKVIPYLTPVVEFIEGLDSDGIKKLRSYFGASAPEKVTMEFLNAIHIKFDEFNPEGLGQWIKEHTGKFNQPSWELGHNNIEPLMHHFIVEQLKKEYGESLWWDRGVPKKIQKDCSNARIESGLSEPDCNFLKTIQYQEIIETKTNWAMLGTCFTPPGMENAQKNKKLSWIGKLNLIRQRYSHPQRDVITEEEYNFLKELFAWLQVKLVD